MNLHKAIQSEPGLIVLAATFAAVLLSGTDASAYNSTTCNGVKVRWMSGRSNMYVSATSFPPGSAGDARLQNAMAHWNAVQGAGFNFYVGRDTDGTHSSSNGVNEIAFESNLGGALAVTRTRYRCSSGIVEADIVFDSNTTWTTGPYSYGNPLGSPINFEAVALHELGHALGLLHEDRGMATMNSFYPHAGPFGYNKEWEPFGDDRLGIRLLYPDGTAERDLAASPLKWTSTGRSGLVASPSSASRGSIVTLEFTFSNLGTSAENFNVGFYLSSNDNISSNDTFLGANYGARGPAGYTGTFSRGLTIPSSIAPGTYYLGFRLDYDSRTAETKEHNNSQQMPRSIRIY